MLLAFSLALCAQSQTSKPFVSPMFSDNMVLQRDMADPVWGWASPGDEVTVKIGGKSASAKANSDGLWLAKVGPLKVGGPYKLEVDGKESKSFDNVMVGDVWICSGQSNMEFGVGNLANPDAETADANYPNIRLYAVPRLIATEPVATSNSEWKVCTQENLKTDGVWGGFTAVGYFFGRDLYQNLHIPIGLIHTSWGGTPAEAWTSAKALGDKLPEFDPALQQIDNFNKTGGEGGGLPGWYQKYDAGTSGSWQSPSLDESNWKSMDLPNYFQKAGIPELVNQQSVVWFRKEVDIPQDASGKDLTIHFVADDNDETWVNGTEVGATDGYNAPRAYKIAANLLKSTGNVITIRVTDTTAPGGIYGDPSSFYLETPEGEKISLAGSWKVKLGAAVTRSNPFPTTMKDNPNFPTVLYNGMINPVVPYGIKGAIWYQGESNAGRSYQYRTLLPTMIGSWRTAWGEGDFPFFIVQLAGFGHPPQNPGDDGWAELREAQMMTAMNYPNCGIATAVDIGNMDDIHPKNKEEVGRRLALAAEAKVYHEKVVYSGPVYRSMKVEGNAIRLAFDHADGLQAKGGEPLRGFAIAGDDHKWVWADAKIDGNTVVVSSPQVEHPVAVRYYWAIYLDCNLANGAGLPAFPFRTDDWKGITQH